MQPRTVLFVTGRLAERSLRRTLAAMEAPFTCEVAVLGITVAALMTTNWISRHLEVSSAVDLIVIPGLCEGDVEVIASAVGVPTEKGPVDVRDIPQHFAMAGGSLEYGAYDIEIVAEINNVPRMSRAAVLGKARAASEAGADYADLGMTPGRPYPELAGVVGELVAEGMQVSVDTLDPVEIRAAVDAGASLVLSVNGSNLDVACAARDAGARVVVIPDSYADMDSLYRNVEKLDGWGVQYLVDPIVDPIGHGFVASLLRFAQARSRYPEAEMLLGIWNIAESTAADSTGVNALLIAFCQELGIRTVLTTEEDSWGRGSVREIDIARRLMHYSITNNVTPTRADERLVTAKDARILAYGQQELRELHADVRDRNFRIFTDHEAITIFNREKFLRGTNIQELFDALAVDNPRHAFYLGRELMKASTAVALGKSYRQEGELDWGYLGQPTGVPSAG